MPILKVSVREEGKGETWLGVVNIQYNIEMYYEGETLKN